MHLLVALLSETEPGSEGATGSGGSVIVDFMHVEAVDWARAATILVGTVILARLLKWAVKRWLHRGNCEVGLADLVARFVSYGLVLLGIVYALMALHVQVGPLLGALGVGGLAVALAAKNLLEDLFGGFVLQARHPFHRGDEIAVGTHEGLVEDVNLRAVVLRSHDGERLFIPSSEVLRQPIVNLTANDARRTTLTFHLPVMTDVAIALDGLRTAVGGATGINAEPAVLAQVAGIGEAGIEVAVKFWHGPDVAAQRRATDAATTAALLALTRLDIGPEVPQRRVLEARPAALPLG